MKPRYFKINKKDLTSYLRCHRLVFIEHSCLYNWSSLRHFIGLPRWLSGKEFTYQVGFTGDVGLILGQEDPLEEEMATHSSNLAWKIPWTEQPGRLQSTGCNSQTRLECTRQHTDFFWNQRFQSFTSMFWNGQEKHLFISSFK